MKSYIRILFVTLSVLFFSGAVTAQTPKINIDDFFGIKFGSSMAETRKIIAAGSIGNIDEIQSDKTKLVVTSAKINYDFKKYNSYWLADKNEIVLQFVNDKFHTANFYLAIRDTYNIFDIFEMLKKDFDDKYYKTSSYDSGDESEEEWAQWKFKQPQGHENTITLEMLFSSRRLSITFQDGRLIDVAIQKEKNQQIVKNYYTSASTYYKEGKYDLAIVDYTNALKLDSDFADAYHFRGHSYDKLNKLELALADFTAALKYYPESTHFLNDRAAVYAYMEGKFDLALADLNKAIKIKPNEARAYLMRARIFCAQGKKLLAAADEKDAISLGGEVKQKCQ